MNPFENEGNNTNDIFLEEKLLITVEKRGRKTNIYLSGWEIPIEELKVHLKNLKRSLGCNGSIKEKEINNNMTTVLHLQGYHMEKLKQYLIEKNVNEDIITIRE